MARHDHPWYGALRVAAIYLVLAVIWIVFSDHAVQLLFGDPQAQATAQTIKGTVFVFASALVILGLVYRETRELRRVEARNRILVDQALAGIYVIREGRFLFANPRLAEILGYEPDELVGSVRVEDVVDPEDRETVLESLRRRESGDADELHYRLTARRADGRRVRLEAHGKRLDWDGQPAVMGLLLDVTEQERLEEQLRLSQRLEALGRVTGAVVHDFNNFLTAIIAPIDLCHRQMAPTDPARAELAEARESAHRAVELTRKLLAFSRRKAYRTRMVDLGDLVRRSEPLLNRLCGDVARLELQLTDGLPPVEVDPASFEQVLVNLVVNAREAQEREGDTAPPRHPGPQRQPVVLIRTRAGGEGNGTAPQVILEVEDDGSGMDEQTRLRAMEPFFTTKANGTGLGLATVHGIVTQAKGKIELESAPGRGTTFRIQLPGREGAAAPLLEAQEDDGSESELDLDQAGATVLVVDDDDAVRRVIERVLRHHGLEPLPAATGEEALALIEEHAPEIALVVTDLGLPDIDGIRLGARIEERIPGTPVLYVSGESSEEVLERFAEVRDRRFVEKPFSVRALMREVAGALGRGKDRVER